MVREQNIISENEIIEEVMTSIRNSLNYGLPVDCSDETQGKINLLQKISKSVEHLLYCQKELQKMPENVMRRPMK